MALAAFGFPPSEALLADGVVMVVLFADVDCEEAAATETKVSDSNEINHNKTMICNRRSSAARPRRTGELVSLYLYLLTTRQLQLLAWMDGASCV